VAGGRDSGPRQDAQDLREARALGRIVKAVRTLSDLSRRELAQQAGLSYSYLAEIENGAKQPSFRALTALSEALGLTVSQLLQQAYELERSEPGPSAGAGPSLLPLDPEHFARLRRLLAPEELSRRQAIVRKLQSGLLEESEPVAAAPRAEEEDAESLLQELRELLALLTPEDRERVLDLARRLAG